MEMVGREKEFGANHYKFIINIFKTEKKYVYIEIKPKNGCLLQDKLKQFNKLNTRLERTINDQSLLGENPCGGLR